MAIGHFVGEGWVLFPSPCFYRTRRIEDSSYNRIGFRVVWFVVFQTSCLCCAMASSRKTRLTWFCFCLHFSIQSFFEIIKEVTYHSTFVLKVYILEWFVSLSSTQCKIWLKAIEKIFWFIFFEKKAISFLLQTSQKTRKRQGKREESKNEKDRNFKRDRVIIDARKK